MILITGGLGFIGSHTARALLDLGQSCVLVQRRREAPSYLADEVGDRVLLEQVDILDGPALLEVGARHDITGIIHLAGSAPWPPGAYEPVDGARASVASLLNVLDAARQWQVARTGIASTIGVYAGTTSAGPWPETLPLTMSAVHPIPAFKKIGELLADYFADSTGAQIVNYRIAGIWGPGGRPTSAFMIAPQLIHAAARGVAPEFAEQPYAEDGGDLCYVKDCARALALLQVSDRVRHRTYNVGSGRCTTNAELAAAISATAPGAACVLRPGGHPDRRGDEVLDIARLRADTDYQPEYPAQRAVDDYLAWLRAGNDR